MSAAELVKQRDEALAEIERLRGVLASAADLFGALGANLAEIRAGIEAEAPCLAPELLAALKAMRAHDTAAGPCDVPGLKCDCIANADAVIAKATARGAP